MEHGCVPVKMIGERKFGEARAAVKRAPIREGGHAFPAILDGKRSDIHPVAGRHIAVASALLIDLRIKVIARA